MNFQKLHVLIALFASPPSCGHDGLLRAGASLLTCGAPSLGLVLIASLTVLPPFTLEVAYERESLSFSSYSTCSL